MWNNLIKARPVTRIRLQYFTDEVFNWVAEGRSILDPSILIRWKREITIYDVPVGALLIASLEGIYALDHLIEENAYWPNIDTLVVVACARAITVSTSSVCAISNNFRGKPTWRPTKLMDPISGLVRDRHTKVRYFQLHIVANEHISWFKISMNNALRVDSLQCIDYLCAKVSRFNL